MKIENREYNNSDLLKYGCYIQSDYRDNVISCNYNFDEKSIEVRCYYTIDFIISFSDKEFVVKRKITDTILGTYIGGEIINKTISPDNLRQSINYIIDYSRLLLGEGYINEIIR